MVTFRSLHPDFGREVSGVDLRTELNDAVFEQIEAAFDQHSLLVFQGQDLTNEQQATFSRRFGPLEPTKVGTPGAGSDVVILSNTNEDGSLAQPGERAIENHRANGLWHSDSSFKPIPAHGSLLSAREIPPEGGETQFASTRVAYKHLPEDLRHRIDGLVAIHEFAHSRRRIDANLASGEERNALPPVRQALVRIHAPTGEKAVYVGSHAARIEGLPDDGAEALIEKLVALVTPPERIYTHKWRVHDLVMWDNRCMVHRGRPFDMARHRRYMVRTTIAGAGPTVSD